MTPPKAGRVMPGPEFIARVAALVGSERGTLVRGAALLGVSYPVLRNVAAGLKRVPPPYVVRLRRAEAEAEKRGGLVPVLSPRLQAAVDAAVRAGASESDALAAVAAWAALRLGGDR